jgi:hypothetical protein
LTQQLPVGNLIAALLVGVVVGAFFLVLARRFGRSATAMLATGLIIAALIYVGFAVRGGTSPTELRQEILGLIVFTLLAVAGLRWWPPLVGIGWLLHGGWDILLHWPVQAWVPGLYPVFCVSFDLVVAAYFLFLFALPKSEA